MPGRNTNETYQSDWIMPPMTAASGATPAVCPLAASTGQVTVDLTTMWGTAAKSGLTAGNEDFDPDPIGHYLSLQADGADIYVAFGPDVGSLTGGNALSATAVCTVTNNAIVKVVGGTLKITNGFTAQFKLPIGAPPTAGQYDNADVGKYSPARFLGFLTAAGTGTLRMWQSSP